MVLALPTDSFGTFDTGDTAWILTSAALVLLMTPGLAFFYGGLSRGKSVLNMMMMSFGSMATVSVVYVLWGFSMAFSSSITNDDDFAGIFANPVLAVRLRPADQHDRTGWGNSVRHRRRDPFRRSCSWASS